MVKRFLILLILTGMTCAYFPSITSFTGGQFGPLMEARADFLKYNTGSRLIENMLVNVQGPVLKRPGTKYIATAKTGKVRLLPFEISTDDAYIIEVGNVYMRFYRNGGQILDVGTPVEIVTVFDVDELSSIQQAMTDDMMYLVSGADPPQVLVRTSHTDWTIADVDFQTGPFLPENETVTTITPSATTGSITLTASTSIFEDTTGASHIGSIWAINQVGGNPAITGDFTANGRSVATAEFTGGYGFTTSGEWVGTVTLQRSTNDGISWRTALGPFIDTNFDNPAETEEDGAIYRAVMSNYTSGTCTYNITVTDDVNKGVVRITAVASGTSATATVLNTLVSTKATVSWREGYWSDFRGWPKTVAFHQQRLVFGGSTSFPQVLWFGKLDPDDYANFLEGTLDTSSFTAALEGQNPIRWLLSQDYLIVGSSATCGIWGKRGEAVTPTSPGYQEQTRHGAESVPAVFGGDSILYIERGARKVREFSFNFQIDKYISPDLTILSPEITESGIVEASFQLRPDPLLWCVLDNGDIATLTYQRDQSVVAWTNQNTAGDFESVAVISSGESEDEVWFSVNRDGTRFIEQLQPFDWGDDQNDAWFVDSGLDYDSTATDTFAGLDHLDGEIVAVWADGIVQESERVAGGTITIDISANRVIAGLPFTAKLETLPIRADPQDYTLNKKIKRLWVDYFETGYVRFGNGPNSELSEDWFFETSQITARQELFTSVVRPRRYSFVYGGMVKQTVYLESDKPAPLGIRAIILDVEIRR